MPFYPVQSISQLISSSLLPSFFLLGTIRLFFNDVVRDGGWLFLFAVISPVVILLAPLRQINRDLKFRIRAMALFAMACFLAFLCTPLTGLLVTKADGRARLGFSYLFLSLICTFFLVSQISKSWSVRKQWFLQLALAPLVLIPSGAPNEFFRLIFTSLRGIAACIIFCVGLFILIVIKRLKIPVKKLVLGFGACALLLSPFPLWKLQNRRLNSWVYSNTCLWDPNFGGESGVFKWLENRSQLKIVVEGVMPHYTFYGKSWQNEVLFDNPALTTDKSAWLAFLCRKRATTVVLFKVYQDTVRRAGLDWPKQRGWLLADGHQLFQLCYQDEISEVWELKPGACTAFLDVEN